MYPSGTGDFNCPHCGGRGVITLKVKGPPQTKRCKCVLRQALIENINRGWYNLSKSSPLRETPLLGRHKENLWITTGIETFKKHLLRVALGQSPDWFFKVITDADLITSWLGSVTLRASGMGILDPDANAVSARFSSLVDLIHPPELLIIRLGVKKARNVAMGEVLWETLEHRIHEGRPVWLVDTYEDPLTPAHICWIDGLQIKLNQLRHIQLEKDGTQFEIERIDVVEEVMSAPLPRRTTQQYEDEDDLYVEDLLDGEDENGFGSQLGKLMANESKPSNSRSKYKKKKWSPKR